MPAPTGERATLSRDLADFLVELSIALHKHAMYPQGHPSLAPAATALTRRVGLLLETRTALSLGVARHQLVIEGVATDAGHAALRDLAGRLHRHHLGAVTLCPGVDAYEIGEALKTLAVDPERTGEPLGLGPPERLRAWPHVQLHPLAYERLSLVEGEPGQRRAAQLWVGLAQAALALPPDQEIVPLEAVAVARAIDAAAHGDTGPSEQAIGGYLLRIAEELKATEGAEALTLRGRISALIRLLKPETLARLVEMGGDVARRRQFLVDATAVLAADAVLEIVKAAADASHQTISHSLLRLLTKLAAHAEAGAPDVRGEADTALRTQVRRLLDGWTLPDPNPDAYNAALQRMTHSTPRAPAAADAGYPAEPERVVAMALEADVVGAPVLAAVDRLLEGGRLADVVERLEHAPAPQGAAAAVWERIATPDAIRRFIAREPVDFKTLDHLVPRAGVAGAAPLLDALATAESRGTRRGLLGQLARLGAKIGPIVVERLDDPRWYVTRNLLALLEELPAVPEGFSPARWTQHSDGRVRWQAVKLQLKLPAERDAALVTALKDPDPRTLRLGLALIVALQSCPDTAVPLVADRATDRGLASDLRVLAIRALGNTHAPAALVALLQLTSAGRTIFGRDKVPAKSAELLGALAALAAGWQADPRARARLARAAASRDPDVRAAAGATERGR